MHSKQKWHLCFIRRNKPHNIQTIISFSFIYSVRNRHTPLALIGVFFFLNRSRRKNPLFHTLLVVTLISLKQMLLTYVLLGGENCRTRNRHCKLFWFALFCPHSAVFGPNKQLFSFLSFLKSLNVT